MKNNIEDISREVLKLVDEWKHVVPIDSEMVEMEIINYIAHLLQPQLETKEDIEKALVNMFLVGQIFTNQNKEYEN
jgi:hypothetical protein